MTSSGIKDYVHVYRDMFQLQYTIVAIDLQIKTK